MILGEFSTERSQHPLNTVSPLWSTKTLKTLQTNGSSEHADRYEKAEQFPTATAKPGEKQLGKLGTRGLVIPYYSQVSWVDTSAAPFGHSSDSPPGRWSHLFERESKHIPFAPASSLDKLAIIPQPAGTTLPNAARVLLCSKDTQMAYDQLGIYEDTQVFFRQAAFQSVSPESVLVLGVVPSRCRTWHFPLQVHQVPVGPFL